MKTLLLATLLFALPAYAQTTFTWDAPTTNTDGSPLTNLRDYKLYIGTTPGGTTNVYPNINGLFYPIPSGLNGNFFARVTAFNTQNIESAPSNEIQFTVGTTPSPSPTRLSTSVPSVTLTPGATRTNTPTLTRTSTSTATRTPSVTSSPSVSATGTATATITNSRTATRTATNTYTLTRTPTWTMTSTSSATLTATPSPTYSITASFTASATSSPTATSTTSMTPTPSPSLTRTATLLPSLSPTATPIPKKKCKHIWQWCYWFGE